jgi:hypothetical protein
MHVPILVAAAFDISWIRSLRWRCIMSLKAAVYGTILVACNDQSNSPYASSLSICTILCCQAVKNGRRTIPIGKVTVPFFFSLSNL